MEERWRETVDKKKYKTLKIFDINEDGWDDYCFSNRSVASSINGAFKVRRIWGVQKDEVNAVAFTSAMENPIDREAWWPTVHGVTENGTWLKWQCTLTHLGGCWIQGLSLGLPGGQCSPLFPAVWPSPYGSSQLTMTSKPKDKEFPSKMSSTLVQFNHVHIISHQILSL